VLGFDFGKMALVLGGLSVGIGFGLQHIVSNFISGLILLFQRPIKAGDWVVVGDYQGHVKHIDAISTEIQTFDNASVLVPNSKLASTEVLNWTHKNTLGRVIVAVGVSYDADVEQVREILLVCAEAHPDILSRPEPRVIFQNFGDSALEFDIRFYIREIDNLMRVASEMRFAIRKAFADAGIVIPFPQHDVHLYQSQTD
jgi:small-conductance mechanosensitive channel